MKKSNLRFLKLPQFETETLAGLMNKTITRIYEIMGIFGDNTSFTLGADYSVTYGSETATGRFNSISWTASGQTGSAAYSYLPDSDLLSQLATGNGGLVTYSYEPNRNLKTQVRNQLNGVTISQYDYQYDQIGRRTNMNTSGSAPWGTVNREPGTLTYTTNNLNQYTQVDSSILNLESEILNLNYDADGNLISIQKEPNGTRYTYDAENRLIAVEPQTPISGTTKVEFAYDYMGRRVQKKVFSYVAGDWQLMTDSLFLYDGWNLISEQITRNSQPVTEKLYVYGLDLSQSLQGAGGIGGLLATVNNGETYHYFYDANGNVGQLMKASDGSIAAHYEYDPYGNIVVESGSLVKENPFCYSTKYKDPETNLLYFGYRYYSPELGRWISRDPGEEENGYNLYAYLANDSINWIDPLGLFSNNAFPVTNTGENKYTSCTRCHYQIEQKYLQAISWRVIWLFERGGTYRELYTAEDLALREFEGQLPKETIIKMRGDIKAKYQAITPPEVEKALIAILGKKKYEKRTPTGSYNPSKSNPNVNATFKGLKWAGRVILVVSMYAEYKQIKNADDWAKQLGSSSSGVLGSIGGGSVGGAGTRAVLSIPAIGRAVPNPYAKLAIVLGGSALGAMIGYDLSSGTFEHLYDIYVCEGENE